MNGRDGSIRARHHADSIAGLDVNQYYAAVSHNGGVLLLPLNPNSPTIVPATPIRGTDSGHQICALSSTLPSRLASSHGSQISITEDGKTRALLPGTGRTITSLAWSHRDTNLLASGTIDGTICLWNIDEPLQPSVRLSSGFSPCQSLEFSYGDPSLIASCHADNSMRIWTNGGLVNALELDESQGQSGICSLAWHPCIEKVVTVSPLGCVSVWDFTEYALSGDSVDAQHGTPQLLWSITLEATARQITWLGEDSLAVLTGSGEEIVMLGPGPDFHSYHQLACFALKHSLGRAQRIFVLHTGHAPVEIIALDGNKVCKFPLPDDVSRNVGSRLGQRAVASVRIDGFKQPSKATLELISRQTGDIAAKALRSSMSSRPPTDHTTADLNLVFTDPFPSAQLAPLKSVIDNSSVSSGDIPAREPQSPSTTRLELPRISEEASRMPFLSPGVPAREPAFGDIDHLPPLDETLLGSPIQADEAELLSSQDRGSDSDDETFDGDGLHGSGTLLPGGINVPLPKACGALFAPNGQLLTFFPPRFATSAVPEEVKSFERVPRTSQARKAAKVFPSFGDLRSPTNLEPTMSDDSSTSSFDDATVESLPRSAMELDARADWVGKVGYSRRGQEASVDQRRIKISVRGAERFVAGGGGLEPNFRFMCEAGELVSDVCLYNAHLARSFELADASHVWQLLALITGDGASGKSSDSDPLGSGAAQLARSFGFQNKSFPGLSSTFGWIDHPMGTGWLLPQVFEWAERLVDVRLLACISALLAAGGQVVEPGKQSAVARASHVPVLRADSSGEIAMRESPTKFESDSRPASRQVSQPGTPLLLDLTSSTPPLGFPTLHRHSSRLSASGSASPEQNRSSFSAAAKSYAQSITDRFAAYGTSPPAKKLSSSPGYELSGSLPTASSSWTKSVSFAPSATTTAGSQISRATSRPVDDDGYDSDRTIEDTSLPQTPKGNGSPVLVNLKNQHEFSDEVTGGRGRSLLPAPLVAKCKVWQRYYAEQLRAVGSWQQAAEMEGIAGLLGGRISGDRSGIGNVAKAMSARVECSICACLIDRLAHTCPLCCCTSHVQCLQGQAREFAHESGGEDGLECSGCVLAAGQ